MTSVTLNDWVRAAVILLALGAVGYLAIVPGSQAAAGGLLALLSAGAGYLFRGRVQTSDTTTTPPAPPVA